MLELKGSVPLSGWESELVPEMDTGSHPFGMSFMWENGLKEVQWSNFSEEQRDAWVHAIDDRLRKQRAEEHAAESAAGVVEESKAEAEAAAAAAPATAAAASDGVDGDEAVLMESVVVKRSISTVMRHKWQRRLFCLLPSKIRYTEVKVDKTQALRRCTLEVGKEMPPDPSVDEAEIAFTFTISSPDGTAHTWAVSTESERERWLAALRVAADCRPRSKSAAVVFKGWAYKKGKTSFSEWKRRYFVMYSTKEVVYSLSNTGGGSELGTIRLKNVTSVKRKVEAPSAGGAPFPDVLEVVTPTRVWSICPDVDAGESVDEWRKALLLDEQTFRSAASAARKGSEFDAAGAWKRTRAVLKAAAAMADGSAADSISRTPASNWQRLTGNVPVSHLSSSPWAAAVMAAAVLPRGDGSGGGGGGAGGAGSRIGPPGVPLGPPQPPAAPAAPAAAEDVAAISTEDVDASVVGGE
eukprot:PLAT12524.11.p1 GENE.PLAT12524.11~~PLAT12524.11.p1  ORF type:complete len:520 (+),score=165.15 PLAT12524.11:162-1562(+)